MRERIADAAKAAGRSMNSEIVARLQASLDGRADASRVEDLERALEVEKSRTEGGLYLAGLIAMHFERILEALPPSSEALTRFAKDIPQWRELNEAVRRQALSKSLEASTGRLPPNTPEDLREMMERGVQRYAKLGRQAMIDTLRADRAAQPKPPKPPKPPKLP
tara:strand:- start:23549 stop:24040 length:492 start_codon:yes stop_codon:yes gene_type:complete